MNTLRVNVAESGVGRQRDAHGVGLTQMTFAVESLPFGSRTAEPELSQVLTSGR